MIKKEMLKNLFTDADADGEEPTPRRKLFKIESRDQVVVQWTRQSSLRC